MAEGASMKRWKALILMCTVVASAPASTPEERALLEVGAARRALALGQPVAAARGFRRAIAAFEEGPDTALRRAEIRLAFADAAAAAGEVPLAHRHRKKAGAQLTRLARSQHPDRGEALRWLGELYRQGLGTERSLEKAARHFLEAAKVGNVPAQVALAELFLVTPARASQGHRWAREAASAGSARGAFLLATSLLSGLGAPANVPEGRRWLERAAGRGSQEAVKLRDDLGLVPTELHVD
jgi:TPR repeat protein